jgi:tetratricopeptide (TPR) repeat protein
LAKCYIYADSDANHALAELKRAAVLLPNSAEVQLMAAWAHKLQNKFRERIAALRRAEAIDPYYSDVRGLLVMTFRWVRDWRQAIDALDRFGVVFNQRHYAFLPWCRANDEFRMSGDIDILKAALKKDEEQPEADPLGLNCERYELAILTRDYTRAAQFLQEIPPEKFHDLDGPVSGRVFHGKPFYEALLAVARGAEPDEQAARLNEAENALRAELEQARDHVDTARSLGDLAIIHALAGRKEDAIPEVNRAIEVMPGAPGCIEKNAVSSALALVYARTGESEKALDLIEHLLTVPCELQEGAVYNMTLVDLKCSWIWDPLRSHPRFQKLLAGPEPATIY